MHKPISLRRNFAWTFLGNATIAFSMWVLLVVLAKLGRADVVGGFTVARSVSLPLSTLLGFQMANIQITDSRNEYAFGHYYTLKLIAAGLAICISVIIGLVFYSIQTTIVIALASTGYAVIEMRKVFTGIMQKAERMDSFALSSILLGISSVSLYIVIFYITRNLPLALTGVIVGRLLVLLFWDARVARGISLSVFPGQMIPSFKVYWGAEKLWKLAKIAIPLGIVGLFGSLFTSVPVLVLDKFYSKDDVGYFAAISSLLALGGMPIAAMGLSAAPRLAKYFAGNVKAYKWLLVKLLIVAAAIGTTGILISYFLGRFILTVMFTADYAEYNYVFVWVAVAGTMLFLFSFLNFGMNAARQFRVQVPLYGIAAGICAGMSFLLIPRYGMVGASWSIILCYIFGIIGSLVVIIRAITKQNSSSKGLYKEADKMGGTLEIQG
jgi:O-antigen/teichoic acid export membrane protein